MAEATVTTPAATGVSTRFLLGCAAVAGPLFLAIYAVQALTRDGYDAWIHPFSLLARGEYGWVQVANFILVGVLSAAGAVGIGRALRPGQGGTWVGRLLFVYGVVLVVAGPFRVDPGLGFPAGAPAGVSWDWTWQATIHNSCPPIAFTAATVACFIMARRFADEGQRGLMVYSIATGVLVPVLGLLPEVENAGVRLTTASTLMFVWVTVVALWLRRQASRH